MSNCGPCGRKVETMSMHAHPLKPYQNYVVGQSFKFGSFGDGNGELNYPCYVGVNPQSHIIVSDMHSHRIQVRLRNISNTRDSVSSHFQTLRRELKIRRAAEYF